MRQPRCVITSWGNALGVAPVGGHRPPLEFVDGRASAPSRMLFERDPICFFTATSREDSRCVVESPARAESFLITFCGMPNHSEKWCGVRENTVRAGVVHRWEEALLGETHPLEDRKL